MNRAEEHETESHGVGDELLSQFKVASFGNLEEDAEASRASFGEEGRRLINEFVIANTASSINFCAWLQFKDLYSAFWVYWY